MKKVITLLLVLVLSLSALSLFACGGQEKICEHVYGVSKSEEFFEKDGKVYTTRLNCNLCGEYKEVANAVVVTPAQSVEAISNATDNSFLFFKKSNYGNFSFYTPAKNVYVAFESGASFTRLTLIEQMQDITFDGITFKGHMVIAETIDGLTIKNCKFSGKSQLSTDAAIANDQSKWIKDVVIDSCSFTNISDGGRLTAIRMANIENLTITNCTFENVDYNCFQAPGGSAPSIENPQGVPSLKGNIKITNNLFKYSGVSALNLHRVHATTCDISGNVFYKQKYYFDTDTGAYGVVIGVNTWEEIPEGNDTQFNGWSYGTYTYDKTAQLLFEE